MAWEGAGRRRAGGASISQNTKVRGEGFLKKGPPAEILGSGKNLVNLASGKGGYGGRDCS